MIFFLYFFPQYNLPAADLPYGFWLPARVDSTRTTNMSICTEQASQAERARKETSHAPTAPSPPKKEESSALDNDLSPTPTSPYSKFTQPQKRLTVFLITFAATFSPMSSSIFFPAMNALSASLHVSVEKVNVTITSYMIVAGIAPAVIGDMADMTGRRIVYLLTLGIYCVANVGLALQSSWTALFALRMLQSAGGAGAYFAGCQAMLI